MNQEQAQSVQETLVLHESGEGQAGGLMFDSCEDVWECAQLVWEIQVLHELRESREGGPMFDPRKDVPFCGG